MKYIASFLFLILSIDIVVASQEIVVTGSRITREDIYGLPAIAIEKKADFLVQKIRMVNDSRSPELRKKEIFGTIGNLQKSAQKIKGIELSYGDGFLVPVNITDDSIQLIEDKKKKDTNYVDIFVKVALNESRSPKKQISELRSFIKNSKLQGRTEIESLDDIGLSIIDPDQYRYDILKEIAKENKKIKDIIGKNCGIDIGSLEQRVEWARTGVDELTLYISYHTLVSCK